MTNSIVAASYSPTSMLTSETECSELYNPKVACEVIIPPEKFIDTIRRKIQTETGQYEKKSISGNITRPLLSNILNEEMIAVKCERSTEQHLSNRKSNIIYCNCCQSDTELPFQYLDSVGRRYNKT